jgi:hypothetical protein
MNDELSGSDAASAHASAHLTVPRMVASLKRRGAVVFVVTFALLSLLPDLLMQAVPMPPDTAPPWGQDLATSILIGVIVIPPAETFLLQWLPMRIARAAGASPWLQWVFGSIPFGLLHFEIGVQSGISALFGGVLLALAFLTWERDSFGKAFLIAAAIHAGHNAIELLVPPWS